MAIKHTKKTISISIKQAKFIEENHINLSRLTQKCIDELRKNATPKTNIRPNGTRTQENREIYIDIP